MITRLYSQFHVREGGKVGIGIKKMKYLIETGE